MYRKKPHTTDTKRPSGFSFLLAVIIISLVGLLIASTLSFSSIDLVKNTIHFDESFKAKAASEGCLEEALQAVRGNGNYAGGNITIGDTVCTVSIVNANPLYTVTIRTVHKTLYTREMEAIFDISGVPKLTSYKEINE